MRKMLIGVLSLISVVCIIGCFLETDKVIAIADDITQVSTTIEQITTTPEITTAPETTTEITTMPTTAEPTTQEPVVITEPPIEEIIEEEEEEEYYEDIYSSATYSANYFYTMGVIYWNDWRWTWYSQRVLPGGGLKIPGRHVDENGYVCDENGYICLASDDLSWGTIVSTPFGKTGRVYDSGPGYGTLDVYVDW